MQAPVVMGLSCSSVIFDRSTTTCMLFTHDPSFMAMKATFLLPRLVRTQPLTTMSLSTTPDLRISAILCVFIGYSRIFSSIQFTRFSELPKLAIICDLTKKSTFVVLIYLSIR